MNASFSDDYNLDSLIRITTKRYGFDLLVTPRFEEHFTGQAYEEMTALLVRQNAKGVRTFIDIGAHYGFFDVLVGLSNPACTILAFEPVPENCEILRRNLELNNVAALVHASSVSDQAGHATFQVSEASDNSGFVANPAAGIMRHIEVDVVRIDDYLDQIGDGPVLVKIDTEGNELKVLDGMRGLIEKCSDLRMVVEFNPRCLEVNEENPEALLERIDQLGFDILFIDDQDRRYEKYHPGQDWHAHIGARTHLNLFCVKKERSLNLCFFSHSEGLHGAERSLLELCGSLTAKYGSVCTVVLPREGPLRRMLEDRGVGTLMIDYQWWCWPTLPAVAEIDALMQASCENVRKALPALERLSPDVILTNTVVIPWGAVAALWLDRPHIWMVREFGQLDHGLAFFFTLQKTLDIIQESSNHIVTNSVSVRDTLFKAADSRKCTVAYPNSISLPEPASTSRLYFKYPESTKLIISGFLMLSKGQDDAVHAVKKLRQSGRDVELCVVGAAHTTFGEVLKALVQTEGLEDRIHFLDFVENVREVIEQADIVLVCSRCEAFGRVTAEAMLLGKPVIGTNTGGTPELIEDGENGFLYSPGNVEQLAERIAFLVDHRDRIGQLGERARKTISEKLASRPADALALGICLANKGNRNPNSPQLNRLVRGWLGAQLAEREQQVQAMRARLAEREQQVQALTTRLERITTSRAWRAALLLRRVWAFSPFAIRRTYGTWRDLRLIGSSGYFDREWYLAHNADVAQACIDPARHYLLVGGFEGRDPGPMFSSQWYLQEYPDVRAAGVNPLVHFVRFGKLEGRAAQPGASTHPHEDRSTTVRSCGNNSADVSLRLRLLRQRLLPLGTRRGRFYAWIKRTLAGLSEARLGSRGRGRVSIQAGRSLYAENYHRMLEAGQAESPDYVKATGQAVDGAGSAVKLIAFYLPQFHPIPQNDEWWGKGFTEWKNVTRAVPQFLGHYQPHLPGELGFYDLRIREVQRRQVELAKQYGLFGFCFYYYWFSGARLLHMPLDEFMKDPQIDMPFCICWANENWTRRWDGRDDEVLMAQRHDPESDLAFANDIMPILGHRTYIRVNGRPLLMVYRPRLMPDPAATARRWRDHFRHQGLMEPYLVCAQVFEEIDPRTIGFDAAVEFPPNTPVPLKKINDRMEILNPNYGGSIYDYAEIARAMSARPKPDYALFKTVFPQWDREPRTPGKGVTFAFSSPALYRSWLEKAFEFAREESDPEKRLVFINAWNEWAEGAHLEPDRRFGYAYLQATADVVEKYLPRRIGSVPGAWSVLFVSHDAARGGSQTVLLNTVEWFRQHTSLKLKVLCLQDGEWRRRFSAVADTAVLSDLLEGMSGCDLEATARKIIQFCGTKPDLIYGNTAAAGVIYPALQLIGAPIVTHIHEMADSVARYARDTLEHVLAATDDFIACSKAVQDYLVTTLGVGIDKVSLVHSSIKADRNRAQLDDRQRRKRRRALGLRPDHWTVFGCGLGMPFRKGADLFIEVGRALRRRGMGSVHLYWIGAFADNELDTKGMAWAEHLSRMKSEGLDKYVTFLGMKTDAQEFLATGDLFLLPSREDPFPLVVLEAAASGLPVICFDRAGGAPEFVSTDAGCVVPFGDTEAMADRVVELLREDSLRQTKGAAARRKIYSMYTVDQTGPQVLSVCRKSARKPPAVSVIVPNYNHATYLPERLDTVFGQTFRDFEVILLDDASTDDSLEILERYRARPAVTLICNQENSGSPFGQWLKGLSMARGEVIWIAESDDRSEPDFLETLLAAFDDPQVTMAYCASRVIDEQGLALGDYTQTEYLASLSPLKWKASYISSDEQEVNEGLGIKNTVVNISAAVFRRFQPDAEFAKTLAGMHVGGDWFFVLNAIRGGKIAYISRLLNHHRRHAASIVGKILHSADDRLLRQFFRDYEINVRYVLANYKVSSDFVARLEAYLHELWRTLAPGREPHELSQYFSLNELRERSF